jgi:hypothetical protein
VRSLARDVGQSTIEYAGVLVLVVALLAGIALVPIDGKPIAGAVSHQLAYALCVVTHGDCDQDRQPCATKSDNHSLDWSTHALIFKAGKHHLLVREDRSDGTAALSLVRKFDGGVEAGTGVKGSLSLGKGSFALGGELSAAVLAQIGSGSTWVLPKARADQLQRRLLAHFVASPATELLPEALVNAVLPGLPPPAQTFAEGGVSAEIGGTVGDGASVGGKLSGNGTFGARIDNSTGRRTYYVKLRAELEGAVHLSALGDASGAAAGESVYAYTVDREGVPIDLAVIETGTLKGSARLTGPLKEAAGAGAGATARVRVSAAGQRTWISESHLDLTDSTNRDAATKFIDQIRSPKLHLGPAVAISKELSRLLAERAVINLRTYAVDSSSYGGTIDASLDGVGVGASIQYSHQTSDLVAATTRGLDGLWRNRDDCVAAAKTGHAQAPAI